MSIDGNGHKRALHFPSPPQRVISLVPSLTESLFELGFGNSVVGITDYCVHPAESLKGLPRLGGTKNPRLEQIIELKPDLVIANQEENPRQIVEALEAQGLAVWVTFPKTVRQALDVLWALVAIFRSQSASIRLQTLELTLDWAISAAKGQEVRYFCPIWFDNTLAGQPWWMTFNRDTYCHDLLALLGGDNIFANRQRKYPLEADLGKAPPQEVGERDTRYPHVTLDEIRSAKPEIILLPDEPFKFDNSHLDSIRELLADVPAVENGRIYFIEGSLITWHGTRLARALRELSNLLDINR